MDFSTVSEYTRAGRYKVKVAVLADVAEVGWMNSNCLLICITGS